LAEKGNKNDNLKGLIQGNLSAIYCEQLLMEEAIAAGKNAAGMYEKSQNYKNEIRAFLLVGNCFLMIEKTDSAFYYYNRCLELSDFHRLDREKVNIRQSLGVIYQEMEEYKKAKESLLNALSITSDDSVEKARVLMNLAKVYQLEKQMDSARYYIRKSLSLEAKEPELSMSTYLLLSEIEEDSWHHKEALDYHKEYVNHVSKLVEKNKSNALLELQGKYNFEKLKNESSKRVIKQQKMTIIFSISFIIASFLTCFFCMKLYRSEKLRLETEQKIESLKKMAKSYSGDDQSTRDILLQHFNILKKAALIEASIDQEEKRKGEKLIKKFNWIVYEQDSLDWDKLYQIINRLHAGLYDKVREMYPQLDEMGFRLCYLSGRSNFSDDEISIIMKISTTNKVRKMRTAIRKKIGVPPYLDLHSFFVEKLSDKQ
jgi:tetratricopeptide (TPR) repeat protein